MSITNNDIDSKWELGDTIAITMDGDGTDGDTDGTDGDGPAGDGTDGEPAGDTDGTDGPPA